MKTRHLRVEFDSEGALKTSRSQDFEDYERKKVRKVYGPKIREALLKALPEVRASRPEDTVDERVVATISDRICNTCYDEFSDCSRTFKRRIFELCSNIKRESNNELRMKILTGQMTVSELVRADTLELAPEDLREKRRQEIERHFVRNVIIAPATGPEPEVPGANAAAVPGAGAPDSLTGANGAPTGPSGPIGASLEGLRQLFSRPNDSAVSDNDIAALTVVSHRNRIISDSEEDSGPDNDSSSGPRPDMGLPSPPASDDYTLDAVRRRIEQRLNTLPNNLAKPFTEPINTAVRRLEMLMERSSIMAKG